MVLRGSASTNECSEINVTSVYDMMRRVIAV